MMLRNSFVAAGFAALLISGCQSSQPQPKPENTPSQPGPVTRHSTAPQPPVMYSVCAENLPTSGQWKGDPVLFDINGDGNLDLAAQPRLANGPHIWYGNGKGGWTEVISGWAHHETSCGGGIEFADLNGNGRHDMAVADHCRGVFVFLREEDDEWDMVTQNLHPAPLAKTDMESQTFMGAEDIAVGDINGDGFPDLIASASDEGGINVYLGDGTGRNWKHTQTSLPTKGWANRIKLVDINRNGKLDLLASYSDGPRLWLGDGKGDFTEKSEGLPSPVIRGLYTGIATADFNGDGLLDIVAANWVDGPEVFLQQKDGRWVQVPDIFPDLMGGAIGLAAGDLDGDGHQDIVFSGQYKNEPGITRGVFVLKGDGKGGFTYMRSNGLPETGLLTTMGVTLGDVNGDGMLDIVAGSGMTVERVPGGPAGPVVPQHLVVWCSQLPARGASLTKGQSGQ
jgi:hypothetical protein